MTKKIRAYFNRLISSYIARHPGTSIAIIQWNYVSLSIRKLRKLLLNVVYILCAASAVTVAGLYYYFAKDLPTLDELTKYRPNIVTQVFSQDGVLIGEYAIEKRYVLPLSKIPKRLVQAFIAAEDARFFDHPGLDFFSIFRAFIKNVREGDVVQGGSTITQQVAKSLLTPERTLDRKAKEAILAYRIEKNLTKDEIIHLYLNQIYLGHGAYGVQAAARNYFNKDVSELTLTEISTLAGLPQAPSKYSPAANPAMARGRQLYVLYRMVEEGYINIVEATDAMNTELKVHPLVDINGGVAPYFAEYVRIYLEEAYGADRLYREGLTVHTTLDAGMQKAAQKALKAGLIEVDKRQGYRGPVKQLAVGEIDEYIKTLEEDKGNQRLKKGNIYEGVVVEIDSRKKYAGVKLGDKAYGRIPLEDMRWARKPDPEIPFYKARISDPSEALTVGDVIQVRLTAKGGKKGYHRLSLFQEPLVQGALLSIDPANGFVKMMVGGYDFEISKFNRAVQAMRQPGSSFKPIIYAAAIDKGYTPSSIIVDAPLSFRGSSKGTTWRPQNYDHKYYGPTTLRNALVTSRNIVTIKLVRDIGLDYIINYARKMGIESPLARDLSLSLGSSSLSLLELTSAYSVFPGGGKRHKPLFITKITDRDGNILEQHETDPSWGPAEDQQQLAPFPHAEPKGAAIPGEDVPLPEGYAISPQTARIMSSLLEGVVEDGTGKRAKVLERPAGGKTGTTNDYIDAWFIGFTPDLVTGTWVGYDERQSLGKSGTGSMAASPIFVDYMSEVYRDKPVKDFPLPDNMDVRKIDSRSGLLAYSGQQENVIVGYYKKGTAPTRRAERKESLASHQKEAAAP